MADGSYQNSAENTIEFINAIDNLLDIFNFQIKP